MKNFSPKTYIILSFLFFITLPIKAEYFFKQLPLDYSGGAYIRDSHTDSKGFVWISSRRGLIRFDGKDSKFYLSISDNKEENSKGDIIYKIIEDNYGNIFVLSDKGLMKYCYNTDRFKLMYDKDSSPITALSSCIYSDGFLLGGKNCIYRYHGKEGVFEKICTIDNTAEFNISDIFVQDKSFAVCSDRWHGIKKINFHTGESSNIFRECGYSITAIHRDTYGYTWISSYNDGVRCYNKDGSILKHYKAGNSFLKSNIILCITERKGELWFGTDGGGISVYNPASGVSNNFNYIPGDKNYSLPCNSVTSIYNDINNNIWIGSVYHGMIFAREVNIKTFTDVPLGNEKGLSNATVLSIHNNRDAGIWIGTDGGGLNYYDNRTDKFTHFPSTFGEKVASICDLSNDELLISIFSKGTYVFNLKNNDITPFRIMDKRTDKRISTHGNTVNLYRNTENSILLLADKVYWYDIRNKKFTIIEDKDKSIQLGTLVAISHDTLYTYLNDIGSLYRINNQTQKMEVIFKVERDMNISSVSMLPDNKFIIGSNKGLISFDFSNGNTNHIPASQFENVSSVVCDKSGNTWIGADRMLFCKMADKEGFQLFGTSDGVLPNDYMGKPRVICGEYIFMGGTQGLLKISRKALEIKYLVPELRLSDVILNGKSVYENQKSIPFNLKMSLKDNLTIRSMAKDDDIFRKRLYYYTITGEDTEKSIVSYNPELNIHSLSPGCYDIEVSCTSTDGTVTGKTLLITLSVLPPWYKSWWFISLCSCILLAIIVSVFMITISRKNRIMKLKMKEHEKQTYEEKIRFLINISHELRTPLTLINAPLHRILKNMNSNDNMFLQLKSIYRQSQRMRDIINMVLDVRKMEVGKNKLDIRIYELNSFITNTCEDFREECTAKGISLEYDLDEKTGSIGFDKMKCESILSNLLANAVKHTPENGTIKIYSIQNTTDNMIRISVEDSGCGIAQEDFNNIFSRFYQGEYEKEGTGIGLSYCKILTEIHGGNIGFYNNFWGKGATFYFEIPIRHMEEKLECKPKSYLNDLLSGVGINIEPEIHEEFDTTPFRILIVDDNSDLRTFLKTSLKKYFKKVLTAQSGEEALNMLKTHNPDIVVSDIMMEGMSGYQLCKHIKSDMSTSQIPVILLTAKDDKNSVINGYKYGADDYIIKPFDIDMLLEIVRNRLKNKENSRKAYNDIAANNVSEISSMTNADEVFISKLNLIITKHISDQTLDVSLICKEIGMSRTSLFSKLKNLTQLGINDYINKIRMDKAVQMVQNSNMSFTDIAANVGFTYQSYFSTAFKKYTGKTPTVYRKEARKENVQTSENNSN